MVVIVSLFYGVQSMYLFTDDDAVEQAVTNICRWLKDRDDKNVIIEAANEHNISAFECHKVFESGEWDSEADGDAKKESGGLPVGCSGTGGYFSERIAKASDVILIHGNAQSKESAVQSD